MTSERCRTAVVLWNFVIAVDQDLQADTFRLKHGHQFNNMAKRSADTIQFPNDKRVAARRLSRARDVGRR